MILRMSNLENSNFRRSINKVTPHYETVFFKQDILKLNLNTLNSSNNHQEMNKTLNILKKY